MRIDPASPTDAEAVVGLWARSGLVRPWNDPHEDFELGTAHEQSEILVARDADAVLGVVLVADDGHRGWIYLLAVDESQRGTGLGRDLVHAAEEWLIRRGQRKLRIMVRNENEQVRGFYEALGYEDQDLFVLGRTLDG